MSERFFTADTHFGHSNIIKYCKRYFCLDEFDINHLEYLYNTGTDILGYKISDNAVYKMNDILFDNINNIVGRSDILYILGDFCWAQNFGDLKKFRDRINCPNVHLVLGNHDRFPKTKYRKLFDSAEEYKEIRLKGQKLTLFHYPMASWNGAFRNGICLHGHCHGKIDSWKEKSMPGLPLIDVGIDVWAYKPISFDYVLEISDAIRKNYNHDVSHPEYRFLDN